MIKTILLINLIDRKNGIKTSILDKTYFNKIIKNKKKFSFSNFNMDKIV